MWRAGVISKKAVVTLAIGDHFKKMASLTHPLMKNYANKCGADFLVFDTVKLKEKLGLVTYEKFQIYNILDGAYDQVLFVDTDIVITPNAPSVFDICPNNTFAASNETSYSMASVHEDATQSQLGKINWCCPYFNSGVMVLSPEHKKLFDTDNSILRNWTSNFENNDHVMSDQPIINYLVNYYRFSFFDLGKDFNRTRVHKDTHNRFKSYFIHYAGPSGHRYGDRLKQIKLDAEVVSNPMNFWISRRFPIYRKLADRLNLDFLKYLFKKYFG
jgi:lipopolysaccharide biosynthesis glycosyltransferase